jgi:hypothetical protein
MSIEKIDFTQEIKDNTVIHIKPKDPIKENSVYTIRIKGVKSKDGKKELPPISVDIMTPLSPMYCTLSSVRALTDSFGIPKEDMLLYIRDASKFADYVASASSSTSSTNTFAREQFVRTKAVLDCLTRSCMERTSSGGGSTYTLDTATIEDSMNSGSYKNMIADLRKDLDKWQDAIRGYFNEGRAKPKATRVGLKSDQNSDVSHTTVDKILDSISRTPPEGSN